MHIHFWPARESQRPLLSHLLDPVQRVIFARISRFSTNAGDCHCCDFFLSMFIRASLRKVFWKTVFFTRNVGHDGVFLLSHFSLIEVTFQFYFYLLRVFIVSRGLDRVVYNQSYVI